MSRSNALSPVALDGNVPQKIVLDLIMMDGLFAVVKFDRDVTLATLPHWVTNSGFFSVTRTADELSIVCSELLVPAECTAERGWCCFRVAGRIPFSTVGVLASLTEPLAMAGISLFAISTYDTDYLLVKRSELGRAIDALRQHGHSIAPGSEQASA